MYPKYTIFWMLIIMYTIASAFCIYVVIKDYEFINFHGEETCFWSSKNENRPWVAVLIGSICGVPPGIFVYYIVKWTVRSSLYGYRSWKLYIFFFANFSFFGLAVAVALDDIFWKPSRRLALEENCVDMAVTSCMAMVQLTMIAALLSSCPSRFIKNSSMPLYPSSEYFIPEHNAPLVEHKEENCRACWSVPNNGSAISDKSERSSADLSAKMEKLSDYSTSVKDQGTSSDFVNSGGSSKQSGRQSQNWQLTYTSPDLEAKSASKLDTEDLLYYDDSSIDEKLEVLPESSHI